MLGVLPAGRPPHRGGSPGQQWKTAFPAAEAPKRFCLESFVSVFPSQGDITQSEELCSLEHKMV